MRGKTTVLTAFLCLIGAHAALAQAGKARKPAAATVEKSASLYGGATIKGSDAALEGEVTLAFQGATPSGGSLDACFATDASSAVSDRIKAPLTVQGNAVIASGTTEIDRAPFELNLKRTGGPDGLALKGTLVVAGVRIDLDAQDLTFQPVEKTEDPGEEAPPASVPAFNAVSIRTPLDKVRPVLDALRAAQAEASLNGLIPTCQDLRAGFSLLDATLAPARMPGLIERLNAIPGVQARMADVPDQGMSVRLSGAQAGMPEKDIAAAVAQAVIGATGGRQVGTTTADPRTGEYAVEVQRESVLSKRAGLAERLSTKFVVGRNAADKATYVNLFAMSAKLVDPSPDGRLTLPEEADLAEEGGSQTGVNTAALDRTVLREVADVLKGQTWDGETEAWK